MMRISLIALVTLICGASAQATPLSREDHAYLVEQTKNGCLTGQAREAANKNLTVGKIQDFCRCFGEGLVDTMQVEDLEKNQETASPEITKASGVVFNKCAVSTFKK